MLVARLCASLALAGLAGLGGVLLVLGEQDDSPGLGGIGLLLVLAVAITLTRLLRR